MTVIDKLDREDRRRAQRDGVAALEASGALDDLYARIDAGDVQLEGRDGLIQQLIKAGLERGLQAEPATATPRPATTAAAATAPTAGHILKVRGGGSVKVKKTAYQIGSNHAGTLVRTAINGNRIDFIDTLTGEVLAEHLLAPPGTRYVSNGHPRGPRRPQTSPMS